MSRRKKGQPSVPNPSRYIRLPLFFKFELHELTQILTERQFKTELKLLLTFNGKNRLAY
jgi:hypothetical protein